MIDFPEIDLELLFSEHGGPARAAWLLRVVEDVDRFLAIGTDINDWVSAYQGHRRKLIQDVWRATVPSHLAESVDYICLGSAGRGEDLVGSDLDHAVIVHQDGMQDELIPYLYSFIRRMRALGVPPCHGFVMSTNPRWIGTQETWIRRVERYFGFPDWDNARYLYMVLDGTPLSEFSERWDAVYRRVFEGVRHSAFICWEMAHLGIHRSVALNVFGAMRTKNGEHGATLNIKEGLQSPITHSVRLLAVANGCEEKSTLARIRFIQARDVAPFDLTRRMEDAVKFAWRARLAKQAEELRRGVPPSDVVEVTRWKKSDRDALITHLETAKQLERFTHRLFRKPR